MLNHEDFEPLLESRANVFGSDGDKIGTLGQIYLDDGTDLPQFATVNTGLFGTKENFVPLSDAEITNGNLYVKFPKHIVKDAPHIEQKGHLAPEDEDRLFEYYSQPGLRQERDVEFEEGEPAPRTPDPYLVQERRPGSLRIRRYDAAGMAPRQEPAYDPGYGTGRGAPAETGIQAPGARENARDPRTRAAEGPMGEGPSPATDEGPEARGPGPQRRVDP